LLKFYCRRSRGRSRGGHVSSHPLLVSTVTPLFLKCLRNLKRPMPFRKGMLESLQEIHGTCARFEWWVQLDFGPATTSLNEWRTGAVFLFLGGRGFVLMVLLHSSFLCSLFVLGSCEGSINHQCTLTDPRSQDAGPM
jgi:hypothetical protein